MEFTIVINAPKEKVWDVLWDEQTYPAWTSAFSAGSRAVTDWQKGSKALFLNANHSGMVSVIVENRPNEFMAIKHLGTIKNGVEDLDSEENKQWAGAFESYTLREEKGMTTLFVEMGGASITREFEDYFRQTWPKALLKLRELSEESS